MTQKNNGNNISEIKLGEDTEKEHPATPACSIAVSLQTHIVSNDHRQKR